MATIWGSTNVAPSGTGRIPKDVSSGGAPSHVTEQQLADLDVTVGKTVQALGSINTNTTITISNGGYVTATISGSLTFTFSGAPTGGCIWNLVLTNGGSATITWPGSVSWTGGTAPTLRTSGVDILRFHSADGGTTWVGELAYDEQNIDASDITSGTLDAARLPLPTTTTIGGVKRNTGSAGQYVTGVDASGNLTYDTPAGGAANTKWVGAGELIPRVTNGAGIDGEELATNDINLDYLAFDSATSEGAQVAFAWPSGFTTFTATFHWTAASGSGGVRWQASATCYADDAALDAAQGTAQAVSDTLLAANDAHKSAATSAITPAGTVTAGNLCVVEIERDPAHGDDTLAVDARLIGVLLEFA